jgi:hypothetical protein
MFKIPKQEYTAQVKDLAVKRVKSGQGVGAVVPAVSSRRPARGR